LRFAEGKKRPSTAVKRVATKRLSVDDRGRVVYRDKQPFRDGRADRLAQGTSCTRHGFAFLLRSCGSYVRRLGPALGHLTGDG
jgi:hypothetical protein